MNPPRKPDHETDEIVDMTPVVTQDEGTQDEGIEDTHVHTQAEDTRPAGARTPSRWPAAGFEMVGDDDEDDEEVEVLTPDDDMPEDALESALEMAQRRAPTLKNNSVRNTARTAPTIPPPAPESPTVKQPGAHGGRTKLVVGAIVILALVAVVGKTLGSGAGHLIGGNSAQHAASPTTANTPTPNTVQVGNKPLTGSAGALILLNPGIVRQGTSMGVTGSGFDPGAVIDLTITRQGAATPLTSSFVQADKNGAFYGTTLNVPDTLSSGTFIVQAKERNSRLTAQAVGTIAGGAPQVKLGTAVGKPGDEIVLALHGFAPRETINVYWNTMGGQPVTTFQADGGGGVGQGKIQVPFGAVGDNTFLFVGATSQSLVAASFLVLQLYPTVKLGSYALKADNLITFSGSGFGPGERVFVFLNNTMGQPLAVVNTDAAGAFKNAPGFVIPFTISGKQTLIFMGEQSRAPEAVNFTVLPYSPIVEASTYGGLPGMTISFYGTGFARNEIVHVYAGHTKSTRGTMVSCFQVNDKGSAAAAGSYLIPGNAQGTLAFALVGEKSGGVGVASLNISAPPAPVQTPPQAPFTCPLDPPAQQGQNGQANQPATGAQPNAPAAPNAPQGKVTQPGQRVAMLRVTDLPSATTVRAGAVPALAAVPARLVALTAPGPRLRDGMPRAGFELLRRMWNTVRQLRITPLIEGLGLLWLAFVLVLNVTLLRRSSRQEAANEAFARRQSVEAARGDPPRVVITPGTAPDGVGLHEATLPPGTGLGGMQAMAVARPHVPPGAARDQVLETANPVVSLVEPPAALMRPDVRAARCTATWHGSGCQPGHDTAFVQTDLQLAGSESSFALFLVADGRSGGFTGIGAGEVAVQHIARRVITTLSNGPGVSPNLMRPLFKHAIAQAGDALLARNATFRTEASTTVTGALVVGGRAYVANVGNSRTYLLSSRGGGLWQITRDHSVVFGMVSAGLVGAAAMDASPVAQQLYRSLGDADRPIRVDTFAVSIFPGDQLLLCSDGLWRKIRDAQIEAILRRTPDPREATWELIQAASARGSEDDISAIVVHVLGAESRAVLLPSA